MKHNRMQRLGLGLLAFSLANACCALNAFGQDWPQWNGENRDGVLSQSDGLKPVPKQGLKLLWKQPVGLGYAGPVVANGNVYVFDYQLESGQITNNPGNRDKLTGQERLICMNSTSGEVQWTHAYSRNYKLSFPGGPRATPVVSGDHVYLLGAEGDLVCLDAKKGDVVWQRNLSSDYKTTSPIWGHAAVPLVLDDQLICLAGGKGSLVVSLDRKTGKEIWRTLSGEEIGYCPPAVIDHGGVKQLIIWDPEMVSSLNPKDGSVYWQQPLKPDYGMSVAPPIVEGNLMFVAGEGVSAMYELSSNPPQAKLLWEGESKTSLGLSNTAAIFDKGYVYGADFQSGALVCARATDGKRMWQTAKPTIGVDRERGLSNGSAYLIKAKDFYFMLSETGDFISAKLSPTAYEETGRFHAIDPTNTANGRKALWTFPAIADGRLYVRNDQEIRCFELAR
jgi:outer membrane protein assembly factor BamB